MGDVKRCGGARSKDLVGLDAVLDARGMDRRGESSGGRRELEETTSPETRANRSEELKWDGRDETG